MSARTLLVSCVAGACLAGGLAPAVQAQRFPSRPVRIIVPFPPGGSVDDVMRLLGNRIAEMTGQNVIIDNRPGASGNVGTNLAARALPDGHTVLAASLSLVVNPSLSSNMGHDVLRDFTPVSLLAAAPFVLAVHPSLQPASVRELVAYARVRPGELNYSSAGSGTNPHIAAELFNSLAKVHIVHVRYKSRGLALAALLGGETQLSFIGVLAAVSYANTGRMRMLGVTGRKRSPVLADVPTVAESGLPAYEFTSWYGVLAPRAMPHDRVVALNGLFRNALLVPDTAERFTRIGADVIGGTPEEFGRHLRAELSKWARVVKESGLRAD